MGRQDAESETLIPTFGGGFDDVAHTLRADGFDASEDGTGRGTPLVPVAYDLRNGTEHAVAMTLQAAGMGDDRGLAPNALPHVLAFAQNQRDEVREMEVAGALAAEPGMKQQTYIAFSCKDHGADAGDIAPTLRSMGHDGSHANAGGQVAVAYQQGNDDGELDDGALAGEEGLPAGSMREVRGSEGRSPSQGRRLAQQRAGEPGAAVPQLPLERASSEVSVQGLREAAAGTGVLQQALHPVQAVGRSAVDKTQSTHAFAVRRLTPRECERLQGAIDDWTLVPSGKKGKPMADGPRYKMLGNSFAVPVIRWIGRQIERATRQSIRQQEAA